MIKTNTKKATKNYIEMKNDQKANTIRKEHKSTTKGAKLNLEDNQKRMLNESKWNKLEEQENCGNKTLHSDYPKIQMTKMLGLMTYKCKLGLNNGAICIRRSLGLHGFQDGGFLQLKLADLAPFAAQQVTCKTTYIDQKFNQHYETENTTNIKIKS